MSVLPSLSRGCTYTRFIADVLKTYLAELRKQVLLQSQGMDIMRAPVETVAAELAELRSQGLNKRGEFGHSSARPPARPQQSYSYRHRALAHHEAAILVHEKAVWLAWPRTTRAERGQSLRQVEEQHRRGRS